MSRIFSRPDKSSPFNSTHYVVLYPQNGDRIVTIESVTSLHPMHASCEMCVQPNIYGSATERRFHQQTEDGEYHRLVC